MTATFSAVTITCNSHGCTNSVLIHTPTVSSARKAAHVRGWRSTKYPTQDWCPECMDRTRAQHADRSTS